jgi:hypothetical protein
MERIEAGSARDEMLTDRDFEGVISEDEETECADEYARKRGLVKHVI